MIERRHHQQEQEQEPSLWPEALLRLSARPDLALLYERIRLRIMGIGLVIAIIVGIVTGFPSGPYVQLAAAFVFAHAVYVERSGEPPGNMTLLIDGAGIALATMTMSIPVVTATAFCFYTVVASLLVSARNVKWVALYTAVWIVTALAWVERATPYEAQTRVIIEVSTVTFFAASIAFIVATVISRLRDTEEERGVAIGALHDSNQRLEELIQSKDRFVASVSPELRTPLTAVIGLSQELTTPGSNLSGADLDDFHKMITHEAEEVARIVEDLLVAARADIGEVNVFPEAVSLASLVAEALESTPGLEDPPIRLIGDGSAFADPIRVKQIVRNLLVNAARYGGDDVCVEIRNSGRSVTVDVCDDGPGIAAGDVDRVFEPYESAHEIDQNTQSIGLGLSVSRTLARLMDGDLTYVRRQDRSIFSLTLPRKAARAEAPTPGS